MPRRSVRQQSGSSILVVDDQQEILLSVRHLLEREGHRVFTADCGERALEILREQEVHLILVDYYMPRMNGDQLIRQIRAFDPLVQIVLQTGYSGEKPPRVMLTELDIQGYHDKADGPEQLLLWVDLGLKAHRLIHSLKERERLQAELVANVSHEFRTPLHIITGYVELMTDGQFGMLSQEALATLDKVAEAGRSLSDLVADFLKYARVQAGVEVVGRSEIQTAELIGELHRLAGVLLEDRDLSFEVVMERAPRTFVSDSIKLRTILRNLITNAVKFTPAGSIRLEVTSSGRSLRFAVRDTGPGIPPEDQALVFEPFRQLDGSWTRVHGGIGLGLALSRKLARLLGGEIDLESEVGRGSTFTVVLPLDGAGDARSAALVPSAAAQSVAH